MSVTFSGEDSVRLIARKQVVWTCPFHDSYWEDPTYYDHYCDCDNCSHSDGEPSICQTCQSGEWWVACDDEGNELYEFVLEPIINQILVDTYLSALTEMLNRQWMW